jgi:hypothetical protein
MSADVGPIFAAQPQEEVQGAMPNKNPVTRHGTIGMTPFIVVLQLFFLYERVEGTCVSQVSLLSMQVGSWGVFRVFCQKKLIGREMNRWNFIKNLLTLVS